MTSQSGFQPYETSPGLVEHPQRTIQRLTEALERIAAYLKMEEVDEVRRLRSKMDIVRQMAEHATERDRMWI